MNDRLKMCKTCKNRSFNPELGLVCGLTSEKPDFAEHCKQYIEDAKKLNEYENRQAEGEVEAKLASIGKRFFNYLIDQIVLLCLIYATALSLGIILATFAPVFLRSIPLESKLFNYAFAFIVGVIYYTLMEATTGRSVAKYITATKVVTYDGNKPPMYSVFVRSICRFIPFEAFSFFGSDVNGWHDVISKTRVIDIKKSYES
ncbi:MAG: hypothetical protein C0596_01270 [Marinilabiliales bacterium]|nr:MAG: hypothetical protein C0596_01270 [Marinilabiliales bacterium]